MHEPAVNQAPQMPAAEAGAVEAGAAQQQQEPDTVAGQHTHPAALHDPAAGADCLQVQGLQMEESDQALMQLPQPPQAPSSISESAGLLHLHLQALEQVQGVQVQLQALQAPGYVSEAHTEQQDRASTEGASSPEPQLPEPEPEQLQQPQVPQQEAGAPATVQEAPSTRVQTSVDHHVAPQTQEQVQVSINSEVDMAGTEAAVACGTGIDMLPLEMPDPAAATSSSATEASAAAPLGSPQADGQSASQAEPNQVPSLPAATEADVVSRSSSVAGGLCSEPSSITTRQGRSSRLPFLANLAPGNGDNDVDEDEDAASHSSFLPLVTGDPGRVSGSQVPAAADVQQPLLPSPFPAASVAADAAAGSHSSWMTGDAVYLPTAGPRRTISTASNLSQYDKQGDQQESCRTSGSSVPPANQARTVSGKGGSTSMPFLPPLPPGAFEVMVPSARASSSGAQPDQGVSDSGAHQPTTSPNGLQAERSRVSSSGFLPACSGPSSRAPGEHEKGAALAPGRTSLVGRSRGTSVSGACAAASAEPDAQPQGGAPPGNWKGLEPLR